MKVFTKGSGWMRTIGSTLVGEGVDSVVFILIATLAGRVPVGLFRQPGGDQLHLQG